MPAPLFLSFLPSKITVKNGLSERGYRATVTAYGRDRFDGVVDYEVRYSPLDLSRLRVFRGQWSVRAGILEVPDGSPISPGFYWTRVRLPGGQGEPSPWELITVDDRPTVNPQITYGPDRVLFAPPGSWMIFENRGPNGGFLGYTRIDVESDPGLLGTCWRYSKSARGAYWTPGHDAALRWFLSERPTPFGPLVTATGGYTLRSPWSDMGLSHLQVGYDGSTLSGRAAQGLLGGFGPGGENHRLDIYRQAPDSWHFYSLLPPGGRVPQGLSQTPLPLIEMSMGHLTGLPHLIDAWHMAALAPSRPDAVLRMRYGEQGIELGEATARQGWSVYEDYDWRADGLVSRIVQYKDVPPLDWRRGYAAAGPQNLVCDLRLVDGGLPDERPLAIKLWDPSKTSADVMVDLGVGKPYQMIVSRADGKPYHGFLEVRLLALKGPAGWQTFDPPRSALWRDATGRPVYVSDGHVTIGPAAHGNPRDWGVQLLARPYLVNSTVNALVPSRDENLIPNASRAAWSNSVTLTIGSVTG